MRFFFAFMSKHDVGIRRHYCRRQIEFKEGMLLTTQFFGYYVSKHDVKMSRKDDFENIRMNTLFFGFYVQTRR